MPGLYIEREHLPTKQIFSFKSDNLTIEDNVKNNYCIHWFDISALGPILFCPMIFKILFHACYFLADELLSFYLTSLFGDTDPLSVDELSEVVDRPHNFNDTMLDIVLEQIGMYLNSSNEVLYDESIMVANFMALMNYFMKRKGGWVFLI